MSKLLLIIASLSLSSCAVGSGFSAASGISAYSINAKTADNLSAEAEARITARVKESINRNGY